MSKDLREFLKVVKAAGSEFYVEVNKPLKPEFEKDILQLKLQQQGRFPVIFCPEIEGSKLPLVSNLFGSYEMLGLAMDMDPKVSSKSDVFHEFRRRRGRKAKPQEVPAARAPVKEVILKGKAIFMELTKKVDVVAENFAAGVMDRLGVGYPEIKKVKPDIIYCSISGFGQDGPYRNLPAFDPVVQGMSGVMEVTGYPENPPVRTGLAAGDQVAALYAVIGLLSALRYREKTGKGQAVDISMMDSLFSLLFDEALDVYVERGIPIRTGNRRLRLTPFNSYKASSYVTVSLK